MNIDKILLDTKLSFKARGLLYVLFNQYGTEFEISRAEILSLSENDKSIATYTAIKELERASLIKRSHTRTGNVKTGKYIIKIVLTLGNNILS